MLCICHHYLTGPWASPQCCRQALPSLPKVTCNVTPPITIITGASSHNPLQVPDARGRLRVHRLRGGQPKDPLLWRQQPLRPSDSLLPQLWGNFSKFCQNLIWPLFFYSLSIWLPTLVLLSTPSSVPLANRLQSWPVYIFFTTYLNLFIQTVPLFLLNFPIEHLCVCSCFYSFDRDSSWAWQGMKISRKDFLYRVISDAVPPQKLPRTEKLILG